MVEQRVRPAHQTGGARRPPGDTGGHRATLRVAPDDEAIDAVVVEHGQDLVGESLTGIAGNPLAVAVPERLDLEHLPPITEHPRLDQVLPPAVQAQGDQSRPLSCDPVGQAVPVEVQVSRHSEITRRTARVATATASSEGSPSLSTSLSSRVTSATAPDRPTRNRSTASGSGWSG